MAVRQAEGGSGGEGSLSLHTFFAYFGSKWRSSKFYEPPRFETIIEPFAGSAGYSVRHHYKRVILVEKDPRVAAMWRYLLRVTPRELLALPDLPRDGVVDDLGVCEEARLLIAYNVNRGAGGPRQSFTEWSVSSPHSVWGRTLRARLAAQVEKIRHWRLIEGDYSLAPDVEATWFIDPPYEELGEHYRHSAAELDFPALGAWCQARRGQVMVCENDGATWLPFRPLAMVQSSIRGTGHADDGVSREVIWTNESAA